MIRGIRIVQRLVRTRARGELLSAVTGRLAVLGLAAAHGKQPEETSADRERDSQPGDAQEAGFDGGLDAIRTRCGLDGCDDDGGGGGGEDTGADYGGCGEAGDEVGDAGAGARAEAEEAYD